MSAMDRYRLSYTGRRIEQCAEIFDRLADTYDDLCENKGDNARAESVIIQIRETARLLKKYTGVFSREITLCDEEIKEIEKVFLQRGIGWKNLLVIAREDGHREIHFELKANNKKCPTTREVAGILTDVLDTVFDSSDNNRIMINGIYNPYCFVECGRFCLMCGSARVSKAGNVISGDSYYIDEINEGKTVIGIFDGMGSGTDANKDSRMAVELVENAIRAGFREDVAIEMVNTALSHIGEKINPVTVDMCVVDTYLGIADFIKLGAVATYIKRHDWVEIIQSETMPIGVLEKADFDHVVKKLYADDYIIMVSDGVLETLQALNKEEEFLNILAGIDSKNPQRMADDILDRILGNSLFADGEQPKDDMTIIVAGLFER